MKHRTVLPVFIIAFILTGTGFAETFRFSYSKDQKYKIVSIVNEDVYIDGRYNHHADIMNKIAIEVAEVREGAGRLKSLFQLTERSLGGTYAINQSTPLIFQGQSGPVFGR